MQINGIGGADLNAFATTGASIPVYGRDRWHRLGTSQRDGLSRAEAIELIGRFFGTHLNAAPTPRAEFLFYPTRPLTNEGLEIPLLT